MEAQVINKQAIILIADPKILAINIIENNERLIDISHQGEVAFGPSPEIPNNIDYTKMRWSVFEKLKQAQTLLPTGLYLCLYEAYRSLQLQETLFNNRYNKIHSKNPSWSHYELFQETIKLISPVINLDGSPNVPPHATGAAIDVYLVDDDGHMVDMGIHPKDWMDDTDGSYSLTLSQLISEEAQQNRQIMAKVLEAVGFVNYPTEYWHWSYGDRYWAHHTNSAYAIYGAVTE